MVRPKDRLEACTGFQWDDGNATKNWDGNDVSQAECEQVFFNQPLVVRRDNQYRLGQYNEGRDSIVQALNARTSGLIALKIIFRWLLLEVGRVSLLRRKFNF